VNKPRLLCFALVVGLALYASSGDNKHGSANTPASAAGAPLRLVQTIPLSDIEGDFDHFGVDLKGNRLFLTAEDHKSVEVFELKTGKHIHSIGGFGEPHYVRYLADSNKLVVVDGGAGEVKFLKGDTYAPIDSAKLLHDADSSAFDPSTGYLYTANGGKDADLKYSTIGITDTKSDKHVGDIRIESPQLEAIALESSGRRMFVNDTAHSQVLVIDRDKRAIVATWPISAGQKNSPMALDEANHRLLVVTRTPPKLVVLDSANGKQVAALPSVNGADDMFLDPARKRIYVSGREGLVMVYHQDGSDKYGLVAKVPSSPGGKTSIFVPEMNRLYVAVCTAEGAKVGAKMASVKVFDVK
jgi:DNA-binding beta-propeller fold protein YncE